MGNAKTASRNGTGSEDGKGPEAAATASSRARPDQAPAAVSPSGRGGAGARTAAGVPAWAGFRDPSPEEAFDLLDVNATDLDALLRAAAGVRDAGHPDVVTYSPKVFIPLTELCRDVCHYCTFAKAPRRLRAAYLSPDEVLAIAQAGERAGCREALFTLGDKPELRYRAAREELARLGYETTIDYLVAMCRLVLEKTRLLPHVNPGVLTSEDIRRLRTVSVSAGIMLESASARLCERGGVHYGSPDKVPECGSQPFAGEARSGCRSPPGSSSASGRRGASASSHSSRSARSTSATATSRRSSSRTSGQSRARRWPARPSRASTISSGRSPPPASCSERG